MFLIVLKAMHTRFFLRRLGTRFGSLEFQIGSLESEKIIIGYLKSEKIGSLESEKSSPYRSIPALAYGGGAAVSCPPSDPKNKKMYKQYSAVYTKMFNFRRITLFCLEKRLSKHKMTIFSKNFWGA